MQHLRFKLRCTAELASLEHNHPSLHFIDCNPRSPALNCHTLSLATQTQHKDITQQQKYTTLLNITKSSMPTSREDQRSTMRKEMSSCSPARTFQETRWSCPSFHQNGQALVKCWYTTQRIRISHLTSLIPLNSAIFGTSSTLAFWNSSHPIVICISQKGNWAELVRLKKTDGKWEQFLNSEANQRLVSHNTMASGKDDLLTTSNSPSQQILMKTSYSNFGYMVAR